jgi:hypothetical protein
VAEAGETQILTGPLLTVTDREVRYASGAIAVAQMGAPQLESVIQKTSVLTTLLTIAATFFAVGIFTMFPPLWISGLALAAFSPVLKVNRPAFHLSVEAGGARKVVYTTAKESEAKLALAAIEEALRRSNGPVTTKE